MRIPLGRAGLNTGLDRVDTSMTQQNPGDMPTVIASPERPRTRPGTPVRIRVAEVLSALTHALDLTEGQPAGHTLRACLIGMRMAEELGMEEHQRAALYYALLLKDAGCSSNAARMAMLFGSEDQGVKYRMKLVDWHKRGPLAIQTARNAGRGGPLAHRVRQFVRIARSPDMTRDLIAIRCDRGAEIVRRIGFPDAAAEAVRSLDEHWNGRGFPDGIAGEQIPLLSRIALLAQTAEIFLSARGPNAALRVVQKRRGQWFDPALADMLLSWRGDVDWWRSLAGPDVSERVVSAEPGHSFQLGDDDDLDTIARAFADIIDAKSPFTFKHSTNVADFARGVAISMGFTADAARRIYRAGLLHDIGKLGISNRILDKNGPLTPEERVAIEAHPVYSSEILERVHAFRGFAAPAVLHHEKLDGSGYPWRVKGERLEAAARILAVVDIFEALTADRPYRTGMPVARALSIIQSEAGTRLCPAAIEGLEAYLADAS